MKEMLMEISFDVPVCYRIGKELGAMSLMVLLAEMGANPRKLLSLCDPQFPGLSCGL